MLGAVGLTDTRTHSRRLAINTCEQNVFIKLTLERSSAKPEVKGWALRHAEVTGNCRHLQEKDTRNSQEISQSKAKKDRIFGVFF